MSIFQADCPHCGTKRVAFTIRSQTNWKRDCSPYLWDTFATCGCCDRGVVATFKISGITIPPSECLEQQTPITLREIAPALPDTGAPSHTPENVARFFEQAMANLPNNWDAAGAMFRKALDTGLKHRFPGITGTLFTRIKKAAKKHELTSDLAAWAHQIRLNGNKAAHEEELFSQQDAKRLSVFTEMVLRYLFTLPGMLDQARSESESHTAQKEDPDVRL